MPSSDRPVFSRRHLFRALLGRDIPPAGTADRQSAAAPHATGDAAYAAGDFPAAVAAYRASVRHDLSNAAVRARLGYALYATGQTIQARVEFEHAVRLTEGKDVLASLGLALTLLRLGKSSRAGQVLAAFADAERPELTALAVATAAALAAAGEPVATEEHIRALEDQARAAGLFPA